MPDTGDLDRNNASASPANWGDAFAALPQDTPDAGGWQRLQARMPTATTPSGRRRWPLWLAAAASLGLVVAIPLRWSHQAAIGLPAPAVSTSAMATPRPAIVNREQLGDESTLASSDRDVAHDKDDTRTALGDGGNVVATSKRGGAGTRSYSPRIAPAHRPIRTIAPPIGATRLATAGTPQDNELELLYAESAKLESVLAMARDDHVTSGTSAALSDGLDAQVASIDAMLMRPDLSHADQVAMWQQRVEALRALASFEGTQRWLASQGDRDEGQLVVVD